MKKVPKDFDPKSRWVRYRDGMWLQSRKRVYLYWFKFLQIAERDPERTVDWSKYDGWGGGNVVLGTKFDDWWEDRWKDLFGIENIDDEPKFPLSTKRPKVEGYRSALLVYENKHRGSNWDIAVWVMNHETQRRKKYPRQLALAHPNLADDIGSNSNEEKLYTQSKVGRLKRSANQYLENVCEGRFP